MNPTVRYVLDANVFIEAKKRYYAFDLCPAFWDRLISLHDEGRILSIDHVKKELLQGNDELSKWTQSVKDSFFASSDDPAVVAEFKQVMEWVQGNPQFTAPAKAAFARAADGWLAAFAHANDLVVATDEVYKPDVRKKVPLPNVCKQIGVPYIDTFGMLRSLGVRF